MGRERCFWLVGGGRPFFDLVCSMEEAVKVLCGLRVGLRNTRLSDRCYEAIASRIVRSHECYVATQSICNIENGI